MHYVLAALRSQKKNFKKWDFNSTWGGAFKSPALFKNGTAASRVVSFPLPLPGTVKDNWIQRQNENALKSVKMFTDSAITHAESCENQK